MAEHEHTHTPIPWEIYDVHEGMGEIWNVGHSQMIAHTQAGWGAGLKNRNILRQTNAEFIVTACNSYYDQQETINELVEALQEASKMLDHVFFNYGSVIRSEETDNRDAVIRKATQALTRAKKEQS